MLLVAFAPTLALASTTNGTVTSGGNSGYAWSDQAGWVNFGATNGNIQITDTGITGYVWNGNYGWINMAPTTGGVTVATNGALSGYAWGSGLGWINFSGVSINSSGKFTGQASGTLIGTLTFDCTNCSVNTDYRPASARSSVGQTATTVSGGGGGGGGAVGSVMYVAGPEGQLVPTHLNAFNVPLQIFNAQSGTLTQNFTSGIRAVVNVPRNAVSARKLEVSVGANATGVSLSTIPTRVVSGAVFDIVARDQDGNLVRTFSQPIQITLEVLEQLQGRTDLGVYFFNETSRMWEKVPYVEFTGNYARFSVDHLTLFGIFSGSDLPQFLSSFFELPRSGEGAGSGGVTEIEKEKGIGVFEGGVPEELKEDILPAQLFDINIEVEDMRITDIKDLVARVIFTSFGRVPTPVDLTFDVLNEDGETVYSKKDKITVRTQEVLTERFLEVEKVLATGTYTLLVKTLYNTDVRDEFRQDFSIVAPDEAMVWWQSPLFWFIAVTLFLALCALVFFLIKKKFLTPLLLK